MTKDEILIYLENALKKSENSNQEIEILDDKIIIRSKKESYNIDDLKQELINYLIKKVINNNIFSECDAEIIKVLFENEKD